VPLSWRELGRLAEVYLRTKWHLDPSRRLATTDTGRKLGRLCLFSGGDGFPSNTKSPGPRTTCVPSGILIRPAVWPQQTCAENGGCAPRFWGKLGPHVAQYGLGRGLPPYQVASWCIQPFGHNTNGPKTGGLCPFFWGGGAGSHLAQCGMDRGPRPCQVPY